MSNTAASFELLEGQATTLKFLDQVVKAGDENRSALGFFPKSVYEEFARHNELYVLVEPSAGGPHYAGHLLFKCQYPKARIFQIYCPPQYRRQGLATKLLDHLKASLMRDGYVSISARVAEDLTDANSFWNSQLFYIQRIEKGGTSKHRQIFVRIHELATPQLFPSSGLNPRNPLGLLPPTPDDPPLYLLDLNVLYDLFPHRFRREEALTLFQAERMNLCRLALSSEISEELRRTARAGVLDPMEAYVSIFSSLPFLNDANSESILSELADLVFPNKTKLGPKDESDLKHLAAAIQNKVAGFITNDEAMLRAANNIRNKYCIDVLSPTALLGNSEPPADITIEAQPEISLVIREVVSADGAAVHLFLSKLKLPPSRLAYAWAPAQDHSRVAAQFGIWAGSRLLAYVTWAGGNLNWSTSVRAAVDEADPLSPYAARMLLRHVVAQLTEQSPLMISMEVPPEQSYLRDFAFAIGFRGEPDGKSLAKVVFGRVLAIETWRAFHAELASHCGIKLPNNIPAYRNVAQQIQVLTPDGNRVHIPLDELETLLSPSLICLPGRPAVITPVQEKFSDLLLNCSPQASLLPLGVSATFTERHYFSASHNLNKFRRGTLILFYESKAGGGRGEVIAIARTREAYLKPSVALNQSDFEPSVFNASNVDSIGHTEKRTVTVFDNIFELPHSVPLKRLQELGCGRPNDLITTHSITDEQLQAILKEGFPR